MEDVKRPYRQNVRARKAAETREKIVKAAVRLHESVGPARTTLVAVAREAGVSRPTVYSHFPDEEDLLRACTFHWLQEDPPPDPTDWLAEDDPAERVLLALNELYSHYERNEQMTENVFRDMQTLESMRSFNLPLVEAMFSSMVEVLISALPDSSAARKGIVSVAIAFSTWQALTRRAGLSSMEAADVMARAVICTEGDSLSDSRN